MRLRDLARDRVVGLFVLFTAAFFYRPLTTETFFFRDLFLLFIPKKLLFAEAIRAGSIPLWDPFTNGGQPYLVIPGNFALHPSNLLYFVLPPLFAFNLVLVLHVLFCAIAAYWLARNLELPAPAAFVTGIAYAFCGYTLSITNLTPLLLGMPWIPMTIGLTHRALRDRRSIAPAAIAAAMPLFGAAAELTAMLFVLVIVWVTFAHFEMTPRRRVAVIAIVILGAIGVSLICTLPATSVIAQSARGAEHRTYESFASWSLHPLRLAELIVPRFFGRTDALEDRDYWGSRWETEGFPYILSIYIGVPVLLLAIAGVMQRDRLRIALAIAALVAMILACGRFVPGFRLLYELPLVAIFRYPIKAMMLALLPIALLAGFGAQAIPRRAFAIVAAAVGVGLLVVSRFPLFALADRQRHALTMSFVHAAIASLAFAAALLVRRRDLALAVVVAADLFVAGFSVNAYAPREFFDEPPLAGVVRKLAGPMRFYAERHLLEIHAPTNDVRWLEQAELQSLSDYAAATFGIPIVFHTDYDQLAPIAIARMTAFVRHSPWEKKRPALDAAGVRVFATRDHVALPGIREVAAMNIGGAPLRLYINENAKMARFAGACGAAPVRMLRREMNAARYEVDAPCDGRVIFAENHYDGWRATVDGAAVPHARADYAFTSVAVGKGHHVIERRYFPPRLIAGAIGTLLTLLCLGVRWRLSHRFVIQDTKAVAQSPPHS